jgi:hypothetical protein
VQSTRKTQVTHRDHETAPAHQDQTCVLIICEPLVA